ncbi:MAG: hypothetical protein M3O36_16005 [Myxococcota bacterium]|nr:hypothetical protein [Myxococcota bacterium]
MEQVTDWATVPVADRYTYVMRLLVETYHYSVNGAAGITGNLYVESGLLPNRLEEAWRGRRCAHATSRGTSPIFPLGTS